MTAGATRRRLALAALVVATATIVALAVAHPAFAQAGPFGVAPPENGAATSHTGVFGWIAARQSEAYRTVVSGLSRMRGDPQAGWWLLALSFAYGVFHAAGPGHGKAVITSYVLANNQTLKRGITLSFVSALIQALVAIVVVGASIYVFRLTALQVTNATTVLERTSALAILSLGLWLVWTKIVAPWRAARALSRAAPAVASEDDVVDCVIGGEARALPASAALCGCDGHISDPATLTGPFEWRRALSAVAAVGLRPCTGALLVLVFGHAQGLVGMGVISVLAMALGTGLTVAALATLAVTARGFALRIAGDEGPWPQRILRAMEIGGALVVVAMGVLLTGASFFGGGGGG